MMPLLNVIKNQVVVTHLIDMEEQLEEIKNLVPDEEEQLSTAIHILKEIREKITMATLPEWDNWLDLEKGLKKA